MTRTLICHPGGPGLSSAYLGELGGLDADLRLVKVDPPPGGPYALEDYADRVDAIREDLGLDRIDLLGHSHGGFVAMTYALRHPDRLGALMLVCTQARFSSELRAESEAAVEARRGEPWFEDAHAAHLRRLSGRIEPHEIGELYVRSLPLHVGDPALAGRIAPDLAGFDLDALLDFNTRTGPDYDLRPRLGEIRAPTLVVTGARDPFGPVVSQRDLAAIPGARGVTLDTGHFPWLEDPEAFRGVLREFLGL